MIPVTDPETGYTHRSMQSFCYAAGLAPNTLAMRRHRDYPPELLSFPGNIQKIPARDHTGRDFESIAEMCRFWRVNPTTFTLRLQRGWSVRKSLTADSSSRGGKRSKSIGITIDGQHFSTLKELSQHLNISSDVLGLRIKRGWTPERLKLMPEKRCRKKEVS